MTAAREDLTGEVAVVTGASRGIGRAVAAGLAGRGARVALLARSGDALRELAGEIGGWPIPCDVTDPEALERAAALVAEQAGRAPDLVVCAAGVFHIAPVDAMTLEELDLNLGVNLRGSILTVRAFLPALKARGRGILVQVGSVAGRRAFPGNGAYAASKFGLRGFHQVLLEELRGTGVRATLLEPAATDTTIWDPMSPDADPTLPDRAGMLHPTDVAEAVLFVASRREGVQIPFLPVERN
jgi:NAD(P)-dependent dehydrogenase (short-subunit alcohol dehydrogenase family)